MISVAFSWQQSAYTLLLILEPTDDTQKQYHKVLLLKIGVFRPKHKHIFISKVSILMNSENRRYLF
jgi:hypothetical protein